MLGSVLYPLINLYVFLIIVYVLFSWFPEPKGILRDIYKVLDSLCGPFLGLFKKLPLQFGGMDLSPIVAIFALEIVATIIVRIFG